jgi:hypothetical protein
MSIGATEFDTVIIACVQREKNHKELFVGLGDTRTDLERLAETINTNQNKGFLFRGFAPTEIDEDWQIILVKRPTSVHP